LYKHHVYSFQLQLDNNDSWSRREAFYSSINIAGVEKPQPKAPAPAVNPFLAYNIIFTIWPMVIPILALIIVAIIRSKKKHQSQQWL